MPETFELLTEQEKILVPSHMPPGTMYYFDEPKENSGDPEDPYAAVLACLTCGLPGMVTKKTMCGAYQNNMRFRIVLFVVSFS